MGCFLQSRSWNGGFITMYMQRTSNSTKVLICHLINSVNSSDHDVQSQWGFSSKNAYQSQTHLVHIIVGFWIGVTALMSVFYRSFLLFSFVHIYGQNPRRRKPHSSKPVFQSQHRKREETKTMMRTLFVNMSKKIVLKSQYGTRKKK